MNDPGFRVTNNARLLQVEDLPWALSLANERYRGIDPGAALTGLVQAINGPLSLAICSSEAFLIAGLYNLIWQPKTLECHVVVLCARPGYHWQAVKLLRASIEWAEARGATRWWFSSITEHNVEALCRRVGARAGSVRYELQLGA